MFEANTTHLWQMPDRIDAKDFHVSGPKSAALPRTRFEFGFAYANEMSAGKRIVFCNRNESASHPLTRQSSFLFNRAIVTHPDFKSADDNNDNHADMGVSTPASASFYPGNASLPQVSA